MKRRSVIALVALGSVLAFASGRRSRRPAPASPAETARAAILHADRECARAAAAGEVESALKFFAEDVRLFPSGDVETGKLPLRAFWQTRLKGSTLSWAPLMAEAADSGDLGYSTGSFEVRESGAPVRRGSYLSVWRRQAGGEWKIAVVSAMPSRYPEKIPEAPASAAR